MTPSKGARAFVIASTKPQPIGGDLALAYPNSSQATRVPRDRAELMRMVNVLRWRWL